MLIKITGWRDGVTVVRMTEAASTAQQPAAIGLQLPRQSVQLVAAVLAHCHLAPCHVADIALQVRVNQAQLHQRHVLQVFRGHLPATPGVPGGPEASLRTSMCLARPVL